MPRLDARLTMVAQQIRCGVHADIGSDHGHLLKALLTAGRIDRGIAIENKRQPFLNSQNTLAGLNADVRLADGLNGLKPKEADSLSICGMGAESIVNVLTELPERIPRVLVLQPNGRPELVRAWGRQAGYHLIDEWIVDGQRVYHVLLFHHGESEADPAYDDIDVELAVMFGPHQLRGLNVVFANRLRKEHEYLSALNGQTEKVVQRVAAIQRVLQLFRPGEVSDA